MKITKEDIQKYVDITESEGRKITHEEAEVALGALVSFIKTIIDHNLNKKD